MRRATLRRAGGPLAVAVLAAGLTLTAAAQPADPAPGREAGLRRVARLRADVQQVGQGVEQFDQRLPALERDLAELARQVEALWARKAEPPPEKPAEPKVREEEYRPPITRQSKKKPGLGLVCRDKKVYVSDMRAVGEAIDKAFDAKDPVMTAGGTLRVGSGDFDVKVTVTKLSAGADPLVVRRLELALRPGSEGETLERVKAPGSSVQSYLGKIDPEQHNLQFSVYPDSHDTFREVRKLVWARRFDDVGWYPYQVGEAIGLGSGPVRVQG